MAGVFNKKEEKETKVEAKKAAVVKETTKKVEKKAPKKEVKKTTKKTVAKKTAGKVANSKVESILLNPRITEKATDSQMDNNVYTFDVLRSATKTEIKAAVETIYGVTVLKVNVVRIPRKSIVTRRGKKGFKSGGKKAYVHVKKGDSIEFV